MRGPSRTRYGRWPRALAILVSVAATTPAQAQGRVTQLMPQGDVFPPLLADPKQPEFLAGVVKVTATERNTTVGAAALGQDIGIARWSSGRGGDGLQVSLSGGVFAQFDLATSSIDLLNADYIIGIPLTWRRGALSVRSRVYHQSSHLGDEYLLQYHPARVNLSFESAEALVSLDPAAWRLYLGGEYIVRREPRSLRPGVLHAGMEYRQRAPLWRLRSAGTAHLAGGIDVRSWEEHGWSPAWNVRAGMDFHPVNSARHWALLVTWFKGPSPYGQFYTQHVRYAGVGLHIGM